MQWFIALALSLAIGLAPAASAPAQDFKKWQAQITEYKRWLDTLGPKGKRYWLRLDDRHRPHKLFVGDGFFDADFESQKRFVEIFSIYLAGHPEKSMLIDLFDASTQEPVGEFGWGGFKLHRR